MESYRRARDASKLARKRRRREERRRLTVQWIGGIFAFVGINGSFVILLDQTGIIELLIDKWDLGYTFSSLIFVVFYFGLAFLLTSTFFWLSDKTGFHYLIEDWVVSWDTWDAQQANNIRKFRTFPRRKRRTLIRNLKRELDKFIYLSEVIQEKKEFEQSPDFEKKLEEFPELKKALDEFYAAFFPFGKEVCDTDDEELSQYDDEELPSTVEGSLERINRVIDDLVVEADISSRSRIKQPKHASWKGFVLALEETSNKLELELKNIDKYHKNIQLLLRDVYDITSKALYSVINFNNDKGKTVIIKK